MMHLTLIVVFIKTITHTHKIDGIRHKPDKSKIFKNIFKSNKYIPWCV